jgi:hypothetical protein
LQRWQVEQLEQVQQQKEWEQAQQLGRGQVQKLGRERGKVQQLV